MSAVVTAMAVINVIAAAAPASAQPDGMLTVEVVKYGTPVFGVRLAELVKGTPRNHMDITGPPETKETTKETWTAGKSPIAIR